MCRQPISFTEILLDSILKSPNLNLDKEESNMLRHFLIYGSLL